MDCKHGLEVAQCTFCKPTHDPWLLDETESEIRIRAKYPGQCRTCGNGIEVGEWIVFVGAIWIHESC